MSEFDTWLGELSKTIIAVDNIILPVTALSWKTFEDCNYFYSCFKLVSKKNLIIFLDYIKQLSALPNIQYCDCVTKPEYDKRLFPTIVKSSLKFDSSLSMITDSSCNESETFRVKWVMFCCFVMNPALRIISPNVKFINDQRLLPFLLGTDPKKFLIRHIYESLSSKPLISLNPTESKPASNYKGKKKRQDVPAKFVKSNPLLSLNMRLFSRDSSRINNILDFIDATGLKVEIKEVNEIFLKEPINSRNIISLLKYENLTVNLIIFTAAKITVTGGSERIYNITGIDSYMNSDEERIIFIYKHTVGETVYTLLKESVEDSEINMKVYQDQRLEVVNVSSLSNLVPLENIYNSREIAPAVKKNYMIPNSVLNVDPFTYSIYEFSYMYLSKGSFRILRVKFFSSFEHMNNVLSDLFSVTLKPTNKPLIDSLRDAAKFISYSDMNRTIVFLSTMNDIRTDSILNVDEVLITGFEKNTETSYWVVGRNFFLEILQVSTMSDLSINIEKPHSLDIKICTSNKSDPITKHYHTLFSDFGNWRMVNFVKDSVQTFNKESVKECVSFVKSNCLLIGSRDLFSVEETIKSITEYDQDTYYKKLQESEASIPGPEVHELGHNISEEDETLRVLLMSMRFRVAHPNLDHNSNLKRVLLNFFPDLQTSSFLNNCALKSSICETIHDFQQINKFYTDFIVLYTICYEGMNYRKFYECIRVDKSIAYELGYPMYMFDINKQSLYHLIPDQRGTFKIDCTSLYNINNFDNTDDYSYCHPNLDSKLLQSFNFQDRNFINFFEENKKAFGNVSEVMRSLLIEYDKRADPKLQKKFSAFYIRKSEGEIIKSEIDHKKDQILELSKIHDIIKNMDRDYPDEQAFKKFWFSFVYTPEQQKLFETLSFLLNEKKIINHPARDMSAFFSEISMLINITLQSSIKSEGKEIEKLTQELKVISEISVQKERLIEIFSESISSIKDMLISNEWISPESFDEFLYKKLKIKENLDFYEKNIQKPEEESSIKFGDIYNLPLDLDLKTFLKFEVKKHFKEAPETVSVSVLDLVSEKLKIDCHFEFFSAINEDVRKLMTYRSDISFMKKFLSELSEFFNKIFESLNKIISIKTNKVNHKLALSNFMSWTHMRHDALSIIFIKTLLPTVRMEEFDDKFSNHFTNLSRTPDLILENQDKNKLLIVEFTYSHNEMKGKLAKGDSVETSKYYPEMYSIINSELYEEVIYFPVVFSRYMSEPNYNSFKEIEDVIKILIDKKFPFKGTSFSEFRLLISDFTSLFLTSTDLIYKPGCLFNYLISQKNRFSFNIMEKYTCVEYNPEFVDTVFKDHNEAREMIHMVHGKYLYQNISRSRILEILDAYRVNPLINEDSAFDSEEFDKIPTSWLKKIFNDAIFSFSVKEYSDVMRGKINFFKELHKKVDKSYHVNKPPFAPYYADGSYILNELYARLMSEGHSDYQLVNSINLDNFHIMRIPRKDITSYFKNIVTFKNPDRGLNKTFHENVKVITLDKEEVSKQIEEFKEVVRHARSSVTKKHNDEVVACFLSMEHVVEFKTVAGFFEDFSNDLLYLLTSKSLLTNYPFLKQNYESIFVNIYSNFKTLFVFSKLSSFVGEILFNKGIINRTIEEFRDDIVFMLDEKSESEREEEKIKRKKDEAMNKKFEKPVFAVEKIKIDEKHDFSRDTEERDKETADDVDNFMSLLESDAKERQASVKAEQEKKEAEEREEKIKRRKFLKKRINELGQFLLTNFSYEDKRKKEEKEKKELEEKTNLEFYEHWKKLFDEAIPAIEEQAIVSGPSLSGIELYKLGDLEPMILNFERLMRSSEGDFESKREEIMIISKQIPIINESKMEIQKYVEESRIKDLTDIVGVEDFRPTKSVYKWDTDELSLQDFNEINKEDKFRFILSSNFLTKEVINEEILTTVGNWLVDSKKINDLLIKLLVKRKFLIENSDLIAEDDLKEYNIIANNLILILGRCRIENLLNHEVKINPRREYKKILSREKDCDKYNYHHLGYPAVKDPLYNIYDFYSCFEIEYKFGMIIIKSSSILNPSYFALFRDLGVEKTIIINKERRTMFYVEPDDLMFYSSNRKVIYSLLNIRPTSNFSGMACDSDFIDSIISVKDFRFERLSFNLSSEAIKTNDLKAQAGLKIKIEFVEKSSYDPNIMTDVYNSQISLEEIDLF